MLSLSVRLIVVAALVQAAGCIPLRIQDTPRVRGVIVDATTTQPVQGARIYFEQFPDRAVMSGADGTFLLPAVMMWHGVPLVGVLDRFDTMRMKVESPGYRGVDREYCHSCDVDNVRIALEPGS
jgi:hypothetical protein